MKKMICLLSIMSVFALESYGSSIGRITLAELESKAELIVLGKVLKVEKDKNIDKVTIQIDSFLKGKILRKVVSFKLVSRGGLKDFDPALKKGDSGVFFLKFQSRSGEIQKAYWGSVAVFPKNHFDSTEKTE